MYSRLNILVTFSAMETLSFFFRHSKCTFFFPLAIFPFVYFRYMNERQIGWLCLHKAQLRTQQKQKTTTTCSHSTSSRLPVLCTDIYLSLGFALRHESGMLLFIRIRTHILFTLHNSSNHYERIVCQINEIDGNLIVFFFEARFRQSKFLLCAIFVLA